MSAIQAPPNSPSLLPGTNLHANIPVSFRFQWSKFQGRVEWVQGQLGALDRDGATLSFIKLRALELALGVACAALEALSELIPA